jgi:hypothetical protein
VHVGEAAELYALGALDEREHAEVEAHIARCSACLRRVGEAEETLLALERGTKAAATARTRGSVLPIERPRRAFAWWIPAAIAAALLVGWLLPRPAQTPNAPVLAMIDSHFSHAQFSGNGPAAKVVYARDRTWYYVLVSGNGRFDVFGVGAGNSKRLGSTSGRGATSELFVRTKAHFDRIELRDGGALVESASIR